jgi:hypothetical protein
MGNGTAAASAAAPTSTRNKLSHRESPLALAPEDIAVRKPLLQVDTTHPSSSAGSSSYGATSLSSSPERMRREGSLLRVPEERATDFDEDDWDEEDEEEAEEWELEQQGLYKGKSS